MKLKKVMSLYWDEAFGEGHADLKGLNSLIGVEKEDFLNDVISILTQARDEMGTSWVSDYKKDSENKTEE